MFRSISQGFPRLRDWTSKFFPLNCGDWGQQQHNNEHDFVVSSDNDWRSMAIDKSMCYPLIGVATYKHKRVLSLSDCDCLQHVMKDILQFSLVKIKCVRFCRIFYAPDMRSRQ